jgi:hypothetical protein
VECTPQACWELRSLAAPSSSYLHVKQLAHMVNHSHCGSSARKHTETSQEQRDIRCLAQSERGSLVQLDVYISACFDQCLFMTTVVNMQVGGSRMGLCKAAFGAADRLHSLPDKCTNDPEQMGEKCYT